MVLWVAQAFPRAAAAPAAVLERRKATIEPCMACCDKVHAVEVSRRALLPPTLTWWAPQAAQRCWQVPLEVPAAPGVVVAAAGRHWDKPGQGPAAP